jgi:hypothetical protein
MVLLLLLESYFVPFSIVLIFVIIYQYCTMKTKELNKTDQSKPVNANSGFIQFSLSKLPTFNAPSFLRSNNECSCWTYSRYSNYMNINEYYNRDSVFSTFVRRLASSLDLFSFKKTAHAEPIADSFE